MQVKKQQVGLNIEQWTGSKLGKEYVKGVYCHPAYLTDMQSISSEMPRWMRYLLLGRKAMTNLDSILKSRDITGPTKICTIKAMVFPVVMYECDSWTIKKAEHQRIDTFELWSWRILFSP